MLIACSALVWVLLALNDPLTLCGGRSTGGSTGSSWWTGTVGWLASAAEVTSCGPPWNTSGVIKPSSAHDHRCHRSEKQYLCTPRQG